jgi:hypothetical protein
VISQRRVFGCVGFFADISLSTPETAPPRRCNCARSETAASRLMATPYSGRRGAAHRLRSVSAPPNDERRQRDRRAMRAGPGAAINPPPALTAMQLRERRDRRCGIGDAAARRVVVRVAGTHRLPPEILEVIGSERGVADRVLNVHVARRARSRCRAGARACRRGTEDRRAPIVLIWRLTASARSVVNTWLASGVLPRRSLGGAFIFFVLTRA